MSFSSRLLLLRKSHKLSQPELAALVGVSDRSVSAWERGLTLPNMDIAIRLADYFNVSSDYLLSRDKDVNDPKPSPDVSALQRAYEKLSQEDREKMIKVNRLLFQNAFDDYDEDDKNYKENADGTKQIS